MPHAAHLNIFGSIFSTYLANSSLSYRLARPESKQGNSKKSISIMLQTYLQEKSKIFLTNGTFHFKKLSFLSLYQTLPDHGTPRVSKMPKWKYLMCILARKITKPLLSMWTIKQKYCNYWYFFQATMMILHKKMPY